MTETQPAKLIRPTLDQIETAFQPGNLLEITLVKGADGRARSTSQCYIAPEEDANPEDWESGGIKVSGYYHSVIRRKEFGEDAVVMGYSNESNIQRSYLGGYLVQPNAIHLIERKS